ncbi:hypothetical protein Ahy_B10g100787 isoform B [Arachis hypogaea]|uniref:Transposase-associated domain-containing protein n=2 Tax=Arachis hypogaea TaxID=3818 RepID=A0A444WXK6_ARAHY|nr:hypothetical protein Ahy_B10g100787 isoform B [Arachis hypogaea]
MTHSPFFSLFYYKFYVFFYYFFICFCYFIHLNIDKSWITKPRGSAEYRDGLNRFLDFAFANASSDGMIHCPCPLCGFRCYQTREDAYDHLLMKPFPPNYTFWLHHGERIVDERSSTREELEPNLNLGDQMRDMVHDAFNFLRLQSDDEDSMNGHVGDIAEGLPYLSDEPSCEARAFHDLLEDGEQGLYPRCPRFSKLSFLVRLYHIKCMCGVSDKAFGLILELLGDAFEHARILKTLHDAKRIIRKLGIGYKKIDACPNDCMLYQGTDQDLSRCKRCGASRWKQKTRKNSLVRINAVVKKNGKPLLNSNTPSPTSQYLALNTVNEAPPPKRSSQPLRSDTSLSLTA